MLQARLTLNVLRYLILLLLFIPITLSAQTWDGEECQDCHDDVDLSVSVHADLGCEICHEDVMELGLEHADGFTASYARIQESCGNCHEDTYDEFLGSAHWESLANAENGDDAAHCYSCHGVHNILPADDPNSLSYPGNLARTCGTCHAKPELVEKYQIPDLHPVELFEKSIHARRMTEEGDLFAATCNDCHGVHNIKASTDPTSTISHSNIAETCGSCHKVIYSKYNQSVHWTALAKGQRESASCVDCHGEHEIILHDDPGAMVNKRTAAEKICASCHTNERLVRKYGLTEGKVSSFQDSYHGLAVLQGNLQAATCYDCHNAHEILDDRNERSSIHVNNLVETCSTCHEGANLTFAQSYTHKSVIFAEKPVEYYVGFIYMIIITLTIGGMFVHNLFIIIRRSINKYRSETALDFIQRFSPSQVMQHRILIISFFTLVITGFALKFPDSAWVKTLYSVGLTEQLRSVIHRIAGVVMIILSLWHVFDSMTSRSGKGFLRAMLPQKSDLASFIHSAKYLIGWSKIKPAYDRFDYTEKAEYWALIWGTIVMIMTGLILFFPVFFTRNSPIWFLKVSEALHYYEAWLATLAIFVWHFFFVIFHPKEYPMSMTWLHGKMTVEEYKHKHLNDFERIMEEIENYKAGDKKIKSLSYQAKEYITRHKIRSK
jgi:formate dehydrogenase gamma subunit